MLLIFLLPITLLILMMFLSFRLKLSGGIHRCCKELYTELEIECIDQSTVGYPVFLVHLNVSLDYMLVRRS